MEPLILASYSETGGATKTTTAVSLAAVIARQGIQTLLIDLDPRGAATKWLDAQPAGEGLHVGAILAADDPAGWAEQMAVESTWDKHLRVIPSDRAVSRREKDADSFGQYRLKAALQGTSAQVVILDCPNRQGGPLIANAFCAANQLLIAATANEDGLDGVSGALDSLARFRRSQEQAGQARTLAFAGIVVGAWRSTIPTRDQLRALEELREAYGAKLLEPLIPERVVVREARAAREWYGDYEAGQIVAQAYEEIAHHLLEKGAH